MATCWAFANMPSIRILITSFSDDAVISIADKVKLILNSDKYKNLFGWVEIRKDVNNKHNLKTTKNGEFYASSVNGTITSKHFDILGVDDPINPKDIDSRSAITNITTKFFARTLPTRKVDKAVTPLILIMQRLGIQDPTDYLIEKRGEDIRHIVLPATNDYQVKPTEYLNIYQDGLLDPIRLSPKILGDAKRDLGLTEYAGQFGQSPVPFGGNIVKKEWFEVVNINDIPNELLSQPVNLYFDGAYTENTKNDPSALLATVFYNNDLYLFDYWRDWKEFNGVMQIIHAKIERYCDARSVLFIETKAIGETVRQEMKRASYGMINLKGHNPKGSKETRLRGWAAKIEAGHIKVIKGAWNDHFIQYVCGFPAMPHDEEVDTLTMACDHNFNVITNNKNSRRWKSG